MNTMSEAELIESATLYFGLASDMMSVYLTVTSGFLVVAYLAGEKLTRSQLTIVSALYLIFALIATYLLYGYGMRGLSYANELGASSSDTVIYGRAIVPASMAFVFLGGIVASLKFMWDVRHPKG